MITDKQVIVERSAQILASFWDFPAARMNQDRVHWQEVWGVDTGSPAAPLNNATLVRPLETSNAREVIARLDQFYQGALGGYTLWDVWQNVDLTPFGLKGFTQPCMVRPAGGAPAKIPPELSIVEAHDAASLGLVERAVIEGSPIPELRLPEPRAIWDERILNAPEFRLWVGLAEGRPVSCALAHIAYGFVFVGFVATVPAFRRRGFAHALTARAVNADPSLPAILHASEMGQPIYARLGFESVASATLWVRER